MPESLFQECALETVGQWVRLLWILNKQAWVVLMLMTLQIVLLEIRDSGEMQVGHRIGV